MITHLVQYGPTHALAVYQGGTPGVPRSVGTLCTQAVVDHLGPFMPEAVSRELPATLLQAERRVGLNLTGDNSERAVSIGLCPGPDGSGCYLWWQNGACVSGLLKAQLHNRVCPKCQLPRYLDRAGAVFVFDDTLTGLDHKKMRRRARERMVVRYRPAVRAVYIKMTSTISK
jgi:hypothetical protein